MFVVLITDCGKNHQRHAAPSDEAFIGRLEVLQYKWTDKLRECIWCLDHNCSIHNP